MQPSSTVADTRHRDLAESRKAVRQSLRQTRKVIVDARKTIADGLQTIVRLKRRLNSLSYISLVPDEVLCEIFFQCLCKHTRKAKYIPFECLDCRGSSPYRDFTAVGSVCHRWRFIVQHSPRLWTFISAGGGMWSMKQALTLSGRMPLQVYFDAGYFDDWRFRGSRTELATKAMRTIFKRLHRTQDLTIAKWTRFMETSLEQYATSEGPVLRNLIVSNCEYFGEDQTCSGGEESSFILSQHCPQLTSLTLDGFAIESIKPSMLPALQELRFETTVSSSTVDKMVSVLESLPHLKVLHLQQWALKSENSEPTVKLYSSSKRVLALPHLQSLSLKGYPAIILRMLDPPLVANANVIIAFAESCRFPEVTGAESEILTQFLNTRRMPGTSTKAVRVVVADCCDMEIEIRYQDDGDRHYAPFLFHTHVTSCLHSLLKLCEAFGPLDIRELEVRIAEPNSRFEKVLSKGYQWTKLVQLTPLLEVIDVQGENRCMALSNVMRAAGLSWPLPALRKLILCPLLPNYRKPRDESERVVEFIQSLVYALTTGKEHGWVLQELHFDLSGLLAEDALTPLGDLVQIMTVIHAKKTVVDSKADCAVPTVPDLSSEQPELQGHLQNSSAQPDEHAFDGGEAAEATPAPDEDTKPPTYVEAMTSDSDMDSDPDVNASLPVSSPSRRRRTYEHSETQLDLGTSSEDGNGSDE